MSIGGNELLTMIENDNPKLGQYLRRYVTAAIETTARNAGVSATGKMAAPPPPERVNVATSGEFMQVTVDHAAPIQKGVQYITHVSTDPEFSQPIVIDHGCSRAPHPFPLPSQDANGNPQSYYVRTIAQYPGSDASAPTYHGGVSPAPVAMSGATQMTLLPGKGSGTGAADGTQSAVGLGRQIFRAAPAPKRSVGNGQ